MDFSDAERASGDYVQPLARGNVLPNTVCFTISSSDSATEHQLERDPVLTKDISLPEKISNIYLINIPDFFVMKLSC